MRSIWKVVLAFTFGTTSGLAFAQTTISVRNANYANDAEQCDATESVRKLCDGLQSCEIHVDPETLNCKMNIPRTHFLRITYSCGGEGKSAQFQDFATARLSCH
jgi:hypothetical protein